VQGLVEHAPKVWKAARVKKVGTRSVCPVFFYFENIWISKAMVKKLVCRFLRT